MAEWSRDKVDSTQLNGGNEFDNNSDFALDEMNAIVNGGLYSQDFAEHLADTPDTSEAGNVGTPSVSFVDNVVGDKTFKKFKFSNIKGDTGAIALETATKFEVSYDPVEGTQVQFPTNVFNRTPVVGDKFVYIHENTSTNDVFIVTGQVINVSSSNVTFNIDEVSKISGPKGDPGIETLVGTEENPINFATSMEVGKLYYCNNIFYSGSDMPINIAVGNFLVYKSSDTAVHFICCSASITPYGSSDRTIALYGNQSNSTVMLYFNSTIGDITDAFYSRPIYKLNGTSTDNTDTVYFYAPTTSGEEGQVLQSNGADQAPSWNSLSTTISESSTDNEIPSALAVYNLIQNSIVSALGGNY